MDRDVCCLVLHKARSKLGHAPPSLASPWSCPALPCPGATAASGQRLLPCPAQPRNFWLIADTVLASNERDCPVKQNKKEVFLCLSLISQISACPLNSSAHRSRFAPCVAAGRIIPCVMSRGPGDGHQRCLMSPRRFRGRGTDLRPSPSGECCRQYSRIKDSADRDSARQRTVAVSQHTVQSSALIVGTAGAGDTRTR